MPDTEYFAFRSRQERLAAQQAPNSAIAAVHTKLADLYDQAASAAEVSESPVPGLRQAG